MPDSPTHLNGPLSAEISNAVVLVMSDYTGRGDIAVESFVLRNGAPAGANGPSDASGA